MKVSSCFVIVANADFDAGLSKAEVQKLKVSELRAELENRGLETSGLKEELIERLENAIGSATKASSASV